MSETIGIIGTGKMGNAIYNGLKRELSENKLFVCDKDESKMKSLGVKNCCTNVKTIIEKVDILVIAVKPQSFDELVKSMDCPIKDKLIVSVMAGVTISDISKKMKAEKIVRCMPNLPVEVQSGVIGWIGTSNLSIADKNTIRRIFSYLGNAIELSDESKIDFITALSGSGPAYFFHLCNMISKKARQSGFSKEEARIISERTFIGSAKLLNENKTTTEEWVEAVASKGGTTEAALKSLREDNFEKTFAKAIDKAVSRFKL